MFSLFLPESELCHLAGADWRKSRERTEARIREHFLAEGFRIGKLSYRRIKGEIIATAEAEYVGAVGSWDVG